MLAKSPGITAVVVLTLGLGIGANTAIFSVVNAVLLRPLAFAHSDRLVMIWESNPERNMLKEQVVPANYLDWLDQNRVFEEMAFIWNFSHNSRKFNVVVGDEAEYIQGRYVSSSFFSVLGVEALLGRTFLPSEDKYQGDRVAVISYELWLRRFQADPGILGKEITLENYTNRRQYTVVGVMPPRFDFPGSCQVWLPAGWLPMSLQQYRNSRRGAHFQVIARLHTGASIKRAQDEMNIIAHRIHEQFPDAPIGSQVIVVPFLEQLVGNVKSSVLLVWGASLCVLIMTCANVANILLARASSREKEIAVRMAMGASRERVVQQLLTESVLLALLGGLVGVGLAFIGGEALMAISPSEPAHVKELRMDRVQEATIDPRVLAFTVIICVVTGVVFGLTPALYASKVDLEQSLKEGSRGSSGTVKSQRMRSVLVIGQVATAFVLLIAAVLMIQSFSRLMQVDPGFRPAKLVTGLLDWVSSSYASHPRRVALMEQIIDSLEAVPDVVAVCGVGELPLEGCGWNDQIVIEAKSATDSTETLPADVQVITPNYFSTLGIPLISGRDFSRLDKLDRPSVAIINKAMAERYWPNQNPIGQRISFRKPGTWVEIVGLVGDIKQFTLFDKARPTIHLPYSQNPAPIINFVLRTTGDPAMLEGTFRNRVLELTKDQPLASVRTMDHILRDSVSRVRFQATLLGLFASVALSLATIGIYGVISYGVSRRTRELGIRMALGAQRGQVLRMVLWDGIKLALAGTVIGVLAAVLLTRLIQSQFYAIESSDPLTYSCVVLVLVGSALIASWVPAYRATTVDPMSALRYE
jgi:putative ABC transport system permease protein